MDILQRIRNDIDTEAFKLESRFARLPDCSIRQIIHEAIRRGMVIERKYKE